MVIEFSILPSGNPRRQAQALEKVREQVEKSGLPYEPTDKGVLIEGDWQETMSLIQKCHDLTRGTYAKVRTHFRICNKKLTGQKQSALA